MGWLKKFTRGLLRVVTGGLLGGGGYRAPEIKMPAPAVEAPMQTQTQEVADIPHKKKKPAVGKRALMIDTNGSTAAGGSTGTGLNL